MDLEDIIRDALMDSLGPDWTCSDGAKHVADAVRSHILKRDLVMSQMLEALRPFGDKLVDIGDDEADDDAFRDMSPENRRAPRITVGHFRNAREAIAAAEALK